MATKHTPGPWKAASEVRFETGLTYVSVQPVTPDPDTMRPLLMASGQHHICRMTHTAAAHAIAMHEANARLIAAAPELLAALREAQAALTMLIAPDAIKATSSIGAFAACTAAEALARAAIAKAEGR